MRGLHACTERYFNKYDHSFVFLVKKDKVTDQARESRRVHARSGVDEKKDGYTDRQFDRYDNSFAPSFGETKHSRRSSAGLSKGFREQSSYESEEIMQRNEEEESPARLDNWREEGMLRQDLFVPSPYDVGFQIVAVLRICTRSLERPI